jgi:hypothetical protein
MRRIAASFLFLISLFPIINSQTVDSIRLEQSGDLIKVHYKILNSNPNQIFRVSVLCSINGGLKSQLNSLSGDFGENVIGGRGDYLILWDVLKDVEELTSAEFFIKAELTKDLSSFSDNVDKTFRSRVKGKLFIMGALEFPGPKGGIRVGYSGNYGISAQLVYGKIPVIESFKNVNNEGVSTSMGISLDLTKRIVKTDSFQMHLIGGFVNHDIYFYWTGPPSAVLWREGKDGAEAGLLLAFGRITGSLIISHFFANKIENGTELDIASPVNYFTTCVGIRF